MLVREDRLFYVLFTHEGKGTNAYWGEGFSDIIGLTVRTHHIIHGAIC